MNRLQEIEARLAAIKVELEKDGADIDALEKEVKDLTEERKKLLEQAEKRKKIINDIASGEGTVIDDFIPKSKEERKFENMSREEVLDSKEYRNAFLKRLLGKKLTEVEERAYSSAHDSAGAVIPTQTASTLFDKMTKIAPMLNEITLLRVAGNLKFAVQNVRGEAAQHAENATVDPAGDNLTYVELAGYEYIKVIRISKTVQTMSINAFEGWLTDMLAEDIAVAIENKIINGSGDGQPKGIEYANDWDDGDNAVEYTDNPSYDDIMDMIALLPQRYHAGAKFLCNSKFLYGKLAKIKDNSGQPILVKDMANGIQFRIMGFPVLLSDKVTDGVMYFGNYKKVVGNLAQDVFVESSTQSGFLSNSIDFRGTAIFDCDIALSDAFIKMSEASGQVGA
jgi:HK97 family phage major capsid protein